MTRAVTSDNPAEWARAKDQFSKVATIIFVGDNYDDNDKTMMCDGGADDMSVYNYGNGVKHEDEKVEEKQKQILEFVLDWNRPEPD